MFDAKFWTPTVSFALCCAFLMGCAVHPSVTYTKITASNPAPFDIDDSFSLQTSTITIDQAAGTKDDSKLTQVTVTSTPTEFPDFKIGYKGNSSWLGMVNTSVNLTKIDNTSLVKSAGVETADNRVADITAAGKVITTLIPLTALTEFRSSDDALDASKLPWTTKTYAQISADPASADAGKPIRMKDGVTMVLGPLPVDAQSIDKLPLGNSTRSFIYAACRDATISFKYQQMSGAAATTTTKTMTVKISDPRYFEVASYPVKGSVSTHTSCGVSVASTTDSTSGALDIAGALAAQGAAIKDAITAAKKK